MTTIWVIETSENVVGKKINLGRSKVVLKHRLRSMAIVGSPGCICIN